MEPGSTGCFKAYDVRGVVPDQLDEDLAYRIGRAYAAVIRPDRVAVGRDVRPSGQALAAALSKGLNDAGVDVYDLGVCGTEMVYFATFHLELGGGIMVTASHNPSEYNGMKFVREEAIPISSDTGLKEIEALARSFDSSKDSTGRGRTQSIDIVDDYIDHLLGYVTPTDLKPLKIAGNPGNGGAGPIVERLVPHLPFSISMIQSEPDGTFPNGVPNPLLPENRTTTADHVIQSGADFGVAWDGDFDRCFFFDERGVFVEGYYIVGLLARALLEPGSSDAVVYDPRLTWNTIEIVESLGGRPILCKSGHAFIKERMRRENAVYGGEMSAHHYFRAFRYCDSGMIPWLLIANLISEEGRSLSSLVEEAISRYPASGEINRMLEDPDEAMARIEAIYVPEARRVDRVDGLSVEFDRWRFNLRKSNTEPLLRLNVEARGDRALMEEKTAEILKVIDEGK